MYAIPFIIACLAQVQPGVASKSTGCGQSIPKGLTQGNTGQSNAMTFGSSNGAKRRYLLHIPTNYDINTPVPLFWSFAGRGKTAEHQENITMLSNSNYNPDGIVVYPQASTNSTVDSAGKDSFDDHDEEDWAWNDEDDWYEEEHRGRAKRSSFPGFGSPKGQWQGDPTSTADDVLFTMQLLDRIEKEFCIDQERIYASGHSNGGGFVANVLACDANASARFAAFAATSGAYYQNDHGKDCDAGTVPLTCNNNGTRVPLIEIHGGCDETIPYNGGNRRKSCLPSIPHFVTSWAERNGLGTLNSTISFHDGYAEHYTFGKEGTDGMVQSYYVPSMGHCWPMEGKKNNISATNLFMDFFSVWNLTARGLATDSLQPASPTSTGSPAATSSGAALQLSIPLPHLSGIVLGWLFWSTSGVQVY